MGRRVLLGVRLALLVGVLVAAVGIAGHVARGTPLGDTWLTTTLGPDGLRPHRPPARVTSRLRNALIGHTTGVLAGLAALAAFGLWNAPSVAETHDETVAQVLAQAAALAVTLLVLTLADAHHAPAGATTLLVASGIAAPGAPLFGLLVGLAIVLGIAPLLARIPGEHCGSVRMDAHEAPAG